MADNPFLQVIRVWAGMAWADGRIAPQEQKAMSKLIESAGFSEADAATARGYMQKPVALDAKQLAGLNDVARKGIYKAAVRLAAVDMEFAPQERSFLDQLREALAIDDADADAIEDEIALPE